MLTWLFCLHVSGCATRTDAPRDAHDVQTDAAVFDTDADSGEGKACRDEATPVEVLFTLNQHGAPDAGCSRPMCRRLISLINAAQSSVDFAIYGVRNQLAVIDALVEAEQRGVEVRGVVDTEGEVCDTFAYADSALLLQRMAAGSVACDDGRGHGYIMHDKFFVFDGEQVWTGSTNISDTELGGAYYSDVSVVVRSCELARAYVHEVQEMFEGLHHVQKLDDTPHKLAPLPDGTLLESYFSPSDGVLDNAVLPLITAATQTLDVAMFYFTQPAIADALLAAHARGVRVRMVLDAGGANNRYSKHTQLCAAGVPVKVENWGGKAHGKWAVADAALHDRAQVLVGSLNWTAAASEHNDENVLLIRSATVADQFAQEFERQWSDLPESLVCARVDPEGASSSECGQGDCAQQCKSGSCCDGLDNDHDGRFDLEEEACGCADGIDNDADGYKDSDDFDCQPDRERY